MHLLFAIVFLAAQPGIRQGPQSSIEVRVARAETVFVGTVASFKETGKRDTRIVTFNVQETLKGTPGRQFNGNVSDLARTLNQWKKTSRRFLVVSVAGQSNLSLLDLDAPTLAVFNSDLRLLKDPQSVIAAATTASAATSTQTFDLPVQDARSLNPNRDWNGEVKVPVDAKLQQLALDWIRSDDVQQRAVAAKALSFFRSDSNEALLRSLLQNLDRFIKSSAEFNNGLETGLYPVRQAAFDVLTKDWKLSVTAPPLSYEEPRYDTVEKITWQGKVTDEGLQRLVDRSKNLKELSFAYGGAMTDRQAGLVGQITSLTTLHFRGPRPTNATLKQLVGLVNLQHIDLGQSHISDDGLRDLATLKNLRSITLLQTHISDDGLQILAGYPSLRSINVALTQVTKQGVAAAKARRPDLEIISDTPQNNVHEYAYRGEASRLRKALREFGDIKSFANATDYGGNTPLLYAVGQNHPDVVKLLLDSGANVNAPDTGRRTPLHWAAWHGYEKIVKLLLERGADRRRRDENGETALDLATRKLGPGHRMLRDLS